MITLAEPVSSSIDRLRQRVKTTLRTASTGSTEAGSEHLVQLLYQRVHSGAAAGFADRLELAALIDALRVELADLRVPIRGWRPVAHSAGSLLESIDGGRVRLDARTPVTVEADGPVVWAPALSAPMDGRWVHWSASNWSPPTGPAVRIYLAARAETAVPVWVDIVRALHGAQVPCRAKLGASVAHRERLDAIVIYLATPQVLPVAMDTVLRVAGATRLRSRTAGFAGPVAAGVGLGWPPADSDSTFAKSFGYGWAARLAHAWVSADADPERAVDAQLDLLFDCWRRSLAGLA